MDTLSLYFKFIGICLRSQMQYRASFILYLIGNFVVTFIEFTAIVVLFSRFDSLQGWRLEEVAMFYGMISVSFALSETFGRGFELFERQVIKGEFDRTLLRPRATEFQVLSHDFQLNRTGRLLQGLAVLIWASVNIGVDLNVLKFIIILFSIVGGMALFTGLIILQATMCFWSTQSLEVMNSFTYGGVEAIQWPLSIFRQWFAKFFIFVIPLACVNYFPVLLVLDKADTLGFPLWFQWISPLAGVLFLGVSLLVWRYGVRHYHSTGS